MKFGEDGLIKFGISKKSDGQMIIRSDKVADANREKYFSNFGINKKNIVSSGSVHGNQVKTVELSDGEKVITSTDGLITDEENLCLAVTISDCLPLFFYDKKNKIIGLAHAGWRGAVGGIAINLIELMKKKFNSDFKDIQIYIGPHIKKCHFEIKNDVLEEFQNYPEEIIRLGDRIFVDLEKIVAKQLISAGLEERNVEISPDCTFCHKEYFSYRRDKPEKVVSQVAYIFKINDDILHFFESKP